MRNISKHSKRFGLVLLFFAGFLYLCLSAQRSSDPAWYQRATLKVVSPVARVLRGVSGFFSSTYHNYLALHGARRENQQLHLELSQLQAELQSLRETNHRLSLRLGLEDGLAAAGRDGRAARVLGYDPSLARQSLILDQGETAGIRQDSAVVTTEGVVGRVMKVGRDSAQVLLITDSHSSVDVVDETTRARGTLVGLKKGMGLKRERWLTRAEYISAHEEIRPGDRLLTSGLDGIFPAGLLVGVVSSVKKDGQGLFWEAEVEPQVEMTKLEEVWVLGGKPEEAAGTAPNASLEF